MRYCKIENGVITKYNQSRRDFGVGLSSDDSVCIAKGYYPVIDNAPAIDSNTQRIGGTEYVVDEVAKTVTKVYTVVDIPAEEIFASKAKVVETAVQSMLDASARERGYDNIVSECSYATSTGAFGVEAQVTVNWRDAVWNAVFAIQADVLAGTRVEPTLEELLLELPTRV